MKASGWFASLLVIAIAVSGGCTEELPDNVVSSPRASFLQLRLAHEEPAPQLEAVQFNGEILHVEAEPVITDDDISAIGVEREGRRLLLDLVFEAEAARRMATATRENTGSRLAILLDSRLYAAPVIQSEIGGRAQLPLELSEIDAEFTEQRIRARWPEP